ncbi:HlyC/CorC family transporter [Clostridiaceae bacterium NSJ-31]|uniref:HlyC/CorC family transporter n=2 Tax=Ligaoa zhengdingensis TaxID=2763658 RepID=A0A926I4K3_9FIRM|nr:hemolysin family protein [Ligaoa zhengdingensis]MBC8546500.1 HlyC/CorC family transporter [Ligaoa zhengdingensis]
MDTPSPITYLALLLLLALSAFFSASETAYSCINRIRMQNLAEDGDENARLALRIAEDFDRMLSTILIGNNVVNLSASSIATVVATVLLGASTGPAVSTLVMTILVLIFGEVMPKSYAKAHAEEIALKVAKPLAVLQTVLAPLSWLFMKLQRAVSRRGEQEPSVTEQELKTIIQNSEEEGVLDEQESDIIQSALDFDDTTVQEILIPRVDMTAIDVDDDLGEILETAVSHGYSRIPVYEDSIDNIIGIIHGKDLLEAYVHHREIKVREMVRECLYVYRSKKISDLLGEFKQRKLHMAIVTDEYGGTLGLVTMEDILEELVGEIWDESDEVVEDLICVSDRCYEVQGDLNIEDFFDEIDYNVKNFECDYSTVGGWALEQLGHIPAVGEGFTYDCLKVTVAEMEEQRIVKLRVELLEEAGDTPGEKAKDAK